jgi:hypothetical protein
MKIDGRGAEPAKNFSPIICSNLTAMTTKIPEDKARKSNGTRNALLDTNVWRYVIDNDAQGSLLRHARDGSYNVQIAPAVLYEVLRLKNPSLRATLVRLMTNSRFYKLMPEAYPERVGAGTGRARRTGPNKRPGLPLSTS